jgi:hypothetical protein
MSAGNLNELIDWDRKIARQLLRIEQVRIHVAELAGASMAVSQARRGLTQLVLELTRLEQERARGAAYQQYRPRSFL